MPSSWRWLDLGAVDGPTMVNLFVALAEPVGWDRSPPTLITLHPGSPFANVGFHQEVEREIDLEHCRAHGIPVVRRAVGGGAVLDGPWEQDYMVVVPEGSPGTEGNVASFYERYLAPVRRTLGRLGVHAERSGINDLAVGGRKVSANGAATLDASWVLVGDILLDLDTVAMSQVLRVPDEKFRGKLAKSMSEWLTSIRALTGSVPPRELVVRTLTEEFAREFGVGIERAPLTLEESERLEELRRTRTADEWTYQRDWAHRDLGKDAQNERAIKISNEAIVARVDHKVGKLVRVTLLHRRGRVVEVQFSGDFFTQPFNPCLEDLERALVGAPLIEVELSSIVWQWFRACGVELIGATPDDLVQAMVRAATLAPASS